MNAHAPYIAPGTNFEVVLLGDSDVNRREHRIPVVESRCSILLRNDAAINACIEQLRISDEKLKADPKRPYDWNRTCLARNPEGGGILEFGVSWYDRDFFEERRRVFENPSHLALFAAIGILPNDVSVTHWAPV